MLDGECYITDQQNYYMAISGRRENKSGRASFFFIAISAQYGQLGKTLMGKVVGDIACF